MGHSLPPIVEAITSNPVRSRADLVQLLHDLFAPLSAGQSTGGARIRLGYTGTHFDHVAAEFEGYARALWGLAPLLAADANAPGFDHIKDAWIRGMTNGCDPAKEDEYWGDCIDMDQRFVEMAAVGFTLAIAPKAFWDPLSDQAKRNLNQWLLQANTHQFPTNNWRFFRVFLNLGLKLNGGEYSQKAIDDELEYIESFYGEHGLPSDGPNSTTKAYDYYATSFAIPFYSLIYAKLCADTEPDRAALYRRRAVENLPLVVRLFAPDGAPIAFGRSMTYRFAVSCFFSAVAYAELELPVPFTWGVIKGLILRTIRYFTQKPEVFDRDGALTIGYLGPSLFMSEDYNSPQSPYWALKTFLILALPESHAFWQAEEEPYPDAFTQDVYTPIKPWMQVFTHAAGHTYCLSSGQAVTFPMRQAAAKYGKFAYSAQFGFSVPTGALGLQQHAPDSTLALSDDEGELWLVRRKVTDVYISDDGVIKSTWKPWPDVEVVTWLIPPPDTDAPYHTRIHRITNTGSRVIQMADAGFAIHSHTGPQHSERRLLPLKGVVDGTHGRFHSANAALAVSKAGASGIVDLLGSGTGRVQDADGNSNLIAPRTVIPMVVGQTGGGDTWLASRVFAVPSHGGQGLSGDGAWLQQWHDAEGGVGGWDGLVKAYPFIQP